MHVHTLATIILILLNGFVGTPTATAVEPPIVVAAGVVDHVIEYRSGSTPSCAGSGVASLTVDLTGGRALLALADTGCAPGFILLRSGCSASADGSVTCVRETATTSIRLHLATDGTLELTWEDPTFHESIRGRLTRT